VLPGFRILSFVLCIGRGDADMPSRKTSVLVVDDDVRILRMMQRILEVEDYRVLRAINGESALSVIDEENPDIVLLDIMMPDVDGCTVCRRIREFSKVPVIMLTARAGDEDKVQGFDAGADDYVTKPFSAGELIARVRAVLRRSQLWNKQDMSELRCNDLMIDFARHRVTLGKREVNLTATEYRLLSYLARNAGRVVTPGQVVERVWGEGYLGETHLLQVNMARLRNKLGDNARNSRYIQTRPGIGYIMITGMNV